MGACDHKQNEKNATPKESTANRGHSSAGGMPPARAGGMNLVSRAQAFGQSAVGLADPAVERRGTKDGLDAIHACTAGGVPSVLLSPTFPTSGRGWVQNLLVDAANASYNDTRHIGRYCLRRYYWDDGRVGSHLYTHESGTGALEEILALCSRDVHCNSTLRAVSGHRAKPPHLLIARVVRHPLANVEGFYRCVLHLDIASLPILLPHIAPEDRSRISLPHIAPAYRFGCILCRRYQLSHDPSLAGRDQWERFATRHLELYEAFHIYWAAQCKLDGVCCLTVSYESLTNSANLEATLQDIVDGWQPRQILPSTVRAATKASPPNPLKAPQHNFTDQQLTFSRTRLLKLWLATGRVVHPRPNSVQTAFKQRKKSAEHVEPRLSV